MSDRWVTATNAEDIVVLLRGQDRLEQFIKTRRAVLEQLQEGHRALLRPCPRLTASLTQTLEELDACIIGEVPQS